MKRYFCTFILLYFFVFTGLYSQEEVLTWTFWLQFTDKNNSPYSIDRPGEFLSERAIQRRVKQNIPIIENDIPVNQVYIDSLRTYGLNKSE